MVEARAIPRHGGEQIVSPERGGYHGTLYLMFGREGAGKSTQGRLLSEVLDIPFIGYGEKFREFADANDPDVGRECREIIENGTFAASDLYSRVTKKIFQGEDVDRFKNGVILDGFVRNAEQAQGFEALMDEVGFEGAQYQAIYYHVPLWRAYQRQLERQRSGSDTHEMIQKRLLNHQAEAAEKGRFMERWNLQKILCNNMSEEEVLQETLKRLGVNENG